MQSEPPATATSGPGSGSVYIFEQVGAQWVAVQKLLDPQGGPSRNFGLRVAFSPSGILNVCDRRARVRSYAREGGTWVERSLFDPINFAYVYTLETDGDRLAVGAGGTDEIFVLRDDLTRRYCSGKQNSVGCVPSISTTGIPSSTSPSPFLIRANDVVPSQPGLLLYSFKKSNLAFHGGRLCVKVPFRAHACQDAQVGTWGVLRGEALNQLQQSRPRRRGSAALGRTEGLHPVVSARRGRPVRFR